MKPPAYPKAKALTIQVMALAGTCQSASMALNSGIAVYIWPVASRAVRTKTGRVRPSGACRGAVAAGVGAAVGVERGVVTDMNVTVCRFAQICKPNSWLVSVVSFTP